jgi:hypothetical protein
MQADNPKDGKMQSSTQLQLDFSFRQVSAVESDKQISEPTANFKQTSSKVISLVPKEYSTQSLYNSILSRSIL